MCCYLLVQRVYIGAGGEWGQTLCGPWNDRVWPQSDLHLHTHTQDGQDSPKQLSTRLQVINKSLFFNH